MSMKHGERRPSQVIGVRARRAARVREQILRAGLKVFAQKGFRGATMDDIALELQATKGLLYYHFKTKEEILGAIIANNELIQGIEQRLDALDSMPFRDALSAAVHGALALMESNGELVRFLHVQAMLSGAEAELVYSAVLERFYQRAERALEHFKRAGEVRPEVDANEAGRLLVDLVISRFLHGQVFARRRREPADYVDRVIEILMRGIAVAKPHPPQPRKRS